MFLASLVLLMAASVPEAPEQAPYPRINLIDYLPASASWGTMEDEAGLAFVKAGRLDGLSVTPPQVEMSATGDMTYMSLSLSFNWVWLTDEQGRRPVWFARLRAAGNGRSLERFADSRECPGVEQSLRQLDGLPTIDPRVPALPDPINPVSAFDDFGGYLHDNTYRVRLRGLFSGAEYIDELELTGRSSSPIAPIIADSLTRLLPCWTDSPPPRA